MCARVVSPYFPQSASLPLSTSKITAFGFVPNKFPIFHVAFCEFIHKSLNKVIFHSLDIKTQQIASENAPSWNETEGNSFCYLFQWRILSAYGEVPASHFYICIMQILPCLVHRRLQFALQTRYYNTALFDTLTFELPFVPSKWCVIYKIHLHNTKNMFCQSSKICNEKVHQDVYW